MSRKAIQLRQESRDWKLFTDLSAISVAVSDVYGLSGAVNGGLSRALYVIVEHEWSEINYAGMACS